MLETTHHQANSRGQTDEDDGEADHHGHLDVHLHHAVDVSDRTAGLATADGVVQRIISAGTLKIFLDNYYYYYYYYYTTGSDISEGRWARLSFATN